jgi:hypothetical protein
MIQRFKNLWVFIPIIILSVTFIVLFTEKVRYTGKVKEHFITSNKAGDPTYNTVALFDDGYYRTLTGLSYYMVPVNGTVYYEIRVFK